jgi:hypothetical protein
VKLEVGGSNPTEHIASRFCVKNVVPCDGLGRWVVG